MEGNIGLKIGESTVILINVIDHEDFGALYQEKS
jgi:hypothetical protein